MKLKSLLNHIPATYVLGNIDQLHISGIAIDSRTVQKGQLFICIRGTFADGHDYAASAIEKGAIALVVEKRLPLPVPQIIVRNTIRAMAIIIDRYFGHPTHSLSVIAVTGTNGKTTTTNLIEKILKREGLKTGLIGTIEARVENEIIPVNNTTPDSYVLQSLFHRMVLKGCNYAIIEASSHALQMGRLWGTRIKTAIFTNLTQDHLDYHESMDKYHHAKSLLFSQLGNWYDDNFQTRAILNADDRASIDFASVTASPIVTYGIDYDADLRATDVKIGRNGTSFTLHTYKGNANVNLKMIGKFNVYNALAAIAACMEEGIALPSIISTLESIDGVNGRFETVDEGQDFTTIVDYAHTPDSLDNVLMAIREFSRGKVICVFGCGGDRDRSKRPLMGAIAAKRSDVVIVTSDNPRSEDPELIISDIMAGIDSSIQVERRVDRREAIELALSIAKKNDIVLIAGKGHETYQTIKGINYHFDDREVVRNFIRGQK